MKIEHRTDIRWPTDGEVQAIYNFLKKTNKPAYVVFDFLHDRWFATEVHPHPLRPYVYFEIFPEEVKDAENLGAKIRSYGGPWGILPEEIDRALCLVEEEKIIEKIVEEDKKGKSVSAYKDKKGRYHCPKCGRFPKLVRSSITDDPIVIWKDVIQGRILETSRGRKVYYCSQCDIYLLETLRKFLDENF